MVVSTRRKQPMEFQLLMPHFRHSIRVNVSKSVGGFEADAFLRIVQQGHDAPSVKIFPIAFPIMCGIVHYAHQRHNEKIKTQPGSTQPKT
jgi:hypothetical protein